MCMSTAGAAPLSASPAEGAGAAVLGLVGSSGWVMLGCMVPLGALLPGARLLTASKRACAGCCWLGNSLCLAGHGRR